jgi:ubiquinone/menaquinone biosynthesis C-methylase UbiE
MLPRTLESEVMDSPDEAREYDAMDHAAVNAAFVDDLFAAIERCDTLGPLHISDRPLEFLDCGTGTARIPIELANRSSRTFVTAVDLSAAMLALADVNIREAELASRIVLRTADGKRLPFDEDAFDAVISNTIVHHIPDPFPALAKMLRVLRPGGLLFVRDLFRPSSNDEVERLVALHAAGESERQQALLRDSLHASLTLDEIRVLIRKLGLAESNVKQTSDRHWTVSCVVPSDRE